MACDAATLEALQVATNKQSGLSERDTLIVLASIYGTAAGLSDSQAAVTLAASTGLARISDRDLYACYLSLIC